MPRLGGRLLAVLSIAVFAANAGAQKTCAIDEGSPNQVARAKLQVSLAQANPGKATVIPQLKDATKLLYDGDMKKNPVGRAYVIGETMVLWSLEPGMEAGYATRGSVGFATDTAAKFDLFQTIDSAFTVVETAMPECVVQVAQWRGQKPWVDLVNHAMELANAGQVDTAAVLAKRSLLLSKNAPYGFYVLAEQAQKNNQPKEAIAQYKLAIAAAKDTAQADAKRTFTYQLGNFAADEAAEPSQAADKAYYLGEAKAAFEMLAKDPGAKYADAARQGAARVAAATGDTTAIKASYADALANPSAFSYASLMNAAVTAARTKQDKDAIKLFEAARTQNPYHRDVLFNLGRLYVIDTMFRQAIPVLRQLIAVDPANPTSFQLMAISYSGIRKQYDSTAKAYDAKSQVLGKRANSGAKASTVKAAIDSAARIAPIMKAYEDSARVNLDSALKYNSLYSDAPVAVAFNDFTPTDTKTSIGGTIANQTDAAKSYTLKIDFLDKSGNTVNTQTVQVGPVPPKQAAPFHADGVGAGIVAFKYAPLT